MRLIFVALCDYENFSTTKISQFTVSSTPVYSGASFGFCHLHSKVSDPLLVA